jgi:hypothetical protein
MIRPTLFIVMMIAFAGCHSDERSLMPTLPSQETSSPLIPATGVITVGREFKDTFIGNPRSYQLPASSTGTLVLRLAWDPHLDGAKLMLTVDDVSFRATAPDWSPVVGRLEVLAGRVYRVRIDEGVAPWDYGFNDPFVLTTAIE